MLIYRIQPRDFSSKQRILGVLISQGSQQFTCMLFVMLANVSYRKQYICERRKIMSALRNQLELFHSRLLVSGDSA